MCLGIDPELGSDVDSLGWLAGDIDLGGYVTWTTTYQGRVGSRAVGEPINNAYVPNSFGVSLALFIYRRNKLRILID